MNRKPGPVPKGAEPRTATLRAKVMPTLKAEVAAAADAAGLTESTWVRDAALEKLGKETPSP